MDDLPEWILKTKDDCKKFLEEYDIKRNQMINLLNQITQRVLKMINERKKIQENIENYLGEIVQKFIIEKKRECLY